MMKNGIQSFFSHFFLWFVWFLIWKRNNCCYLVNESKVPDCCLKRKTFFFFYQILWENKIKVQFIVLTRAILLLFIDRTRNVNSLSFSSREIKAMSSSICVRKIEVCWHLTTLFGIHSMIFARSICYIV